ncbi:molybdopterin molybdotransferase MoeA [Chloroflexi bacterium TSY]|nr:molybdopterin molybdotransferase MoeA [Chloroflexi bacterium TSY]
MSEFFNVRTPEEAEALLTKHFQPQVRAERLSTAAALDRILVESLTSPQDLPDFVRSTVDGYAANAADTYGASPGLPAFLTVVGEVPMGQRTNLQLGVGEAALVHTGGMLPGGASAVVMVENTQLVDTMAGTRSDEEANRVVGSIEVMTAVAEGENLIQIGEDVHKDETVLTAGRQLRPQDIGAMLALGITTINVAIPPKVAIISTGDEVVPPEQSTVPGQIRDINSYTLAALTQRAGGKPILCGIVADERTALEAAATKAHADADIVVLSAGSSVSYRDMSVDVIAGLGSPGVLVHGVSVRPGKPTIVAVCDGKPVFGLPGNPVSAMVIFDLLVAPTIRMMLGMKRGTPKQIQAFLGRNVASAAGREDYVQVRLEERDGEQWATPVFGKSNLIYTLVHADGLVKVPLDANGIREGERVTVYLH